MIFDDLCKNCDFFSNFRFSKFIFVFFRKQTNSQKIILPDRKAHVDFKFHILNNMSFWKMNAVFFIKTVTLLGTPKRNVLFWAPKIVTKQPRVYRFLSFKRWWIIAPSGYCAFWLDQKQLRLLGAIIHLFLCILFIFF